MRGGGGGGVQVVECLPSKHEALSLNPSATRKKDQNYKNDRAKNLRRIGREADRANGLG
jgi:hypothetical protein